MKEQDTVKIDWKSQKAGLGVVWQKNMGLFEGVGQEGPGGHKPGITGKEERR